MQKYSLLTKASEIMGGGPKDIEGLSEYTYSALWPF